MNPELAQLSVLFRLHLTEQILTSSHFHVAVTIDFERGAKQAVIGLANRLSQSLVGFAGRGEATPAERWRCETLSAWRRSPQARPDRSKDRAASR
jgi:hypothetical protein